MTTHSNKRRGVFLLVFALLIIAGIAVILLARNGNSRGVSITPLQLTAKPPMLNQQVKVMESYYSVPAINSLESLASGEQVKDVLFCNLKPDGSPAYSPSAYKALMDKKAVCLSGYMEATKLREQAGVIQGNLGTVESILAALNMTKKELNDNSDYGFNIVVIPSGSFLPVPIQYATNIQMKCVVNAGGSKSPTGIGTLRELKASGYYLKTSASVAKFYGIEKKVARILKQVEDLNSGNLNALEYAYAYAVIVANAISLEKEAVSAGIPLTPAAAKKYYRSILASGPFASVGMGFYRNDGGKRFSSNDMVSCKDPNGFIGAVGVEVGAQSFSFTDFCAAPDDFSKLTQSVNNSEQSFIKMKTSLEAQLKANTDALKKLEDTDYNCGSGSEK